MAYDKRTRYDQTRNIGLGSGVYVAKVVSTMDPTFNGRLKVTLLKAHGNELGTENQTYLVNYASPFFGMTPFEGMGYNENDFNDTQKSYGMWAIPPDVGVTVLVLFADGDPGRGYWFACVPPAFSNNMVPAIGSTTELDISEEDKKRYNTSQPLPVGEINKLLNAKLDNEIDAEKIKKPVHPIADRFLRQGTIEDDVRGPSVSSARRQVPNTVFGISTPGPLDYGTNAKRMAIGPAESQSRTAVPISRLGGTQFVMDDGDDRFQRKTSPGVGPVEYADVNAGEKGIPDLPYNEYTRLRTRTGHQLLLHNTEDLIYLTNSGGTAWIEMTSNGKIDIYGADSISVHSENDLNIRADRDVNIEAGRNINMKATAEYVSPDDLHRRAEGDTKTISKIVDGDEIESGRIQIESAFNTNILIGANGKIETRQYTNQDDVSTNGDLDIKVAGNHRHTVGGTTDINTIGDRSDTQANWDINTGGYNYLTSGANTEVASGADILMSASPNIHFNGPAATSAALADPAQSITDLITHDNIFTNTVSNWNPTKYQQGAFNSIMKRIPMHEPWALHENQTPNFLQPSNTDRERPSEE
jgi:hypothetical protein